MLSRLNHPHRENGLPPCREITPPPRVYKMIELSIQKWPKPHLYKNALNLPEIPKTLLFTEIIKISPTLYKKHQNFTHLYILKFTFLYGFSHSRLWDTPLNDFGTLNTPKHTNLYLLFTQKCLNFTSLKKSPNLPIFKAAERWIAEHVDVHY